MAVSVLTLPFDTERRDFVDDALEGAFEGRAIEDIHEHLFYQEGRPHLVLVVRHRDEATGGARASRPDPAQTLDELALERYQRLRSWRREQAREEGVSAFLVATNQMLADVAAHPPHSLAALRQIKGFGDKRLERYGEELIRLMEQPLEAAVPGGVPAG